MTGPPNILVIMTDEERERIWFPETVRLPHRERLAARGTTFPNHHTHSTPCTPSRSTMLTGRHTDVTGMADNINFSWQDAMRTDLPTWATMLRTAGYDCAYKGKWHLGNVDRSHGMRRFGFDDWEAPDVHGTPYIGGAKDRMTARRAARWLTERPGPGRPGGDRPWLLVASFVNPHDIWLYPRFRRLRETDHGADPPESFGDDLRGKPATHERWKATCDMTAGRVRSEAQWRMIANAYVDLQIEVDDHIGTVLDALDASGAAADTVVVFTSDHGDMAGAHGLRQKGPFVYRECVNVPLTVAWPGRSIAGSVATGLSAHADLAPTLCAIAGIPGDEAAERWSLPGVSLVPVIDDPTARVRDEVLFTSDAFSSLGPEGPHRGFLRGRTDGRHKVARYFARGEQHAPRDQQDLELYDLGADPFEMTNLAGDPMHRGLLHEQLDRLDSLVARELGDDDLVREEPRTRLRHLAALNRRWNRAA